MTKQAPTDRPTDRMHAAGDEDCAAVSDGGARLCGEVDEGVSGGIVRRRTSKQFRAEIFSPDFMQQGVKRCVRPLSLQM